MVSEPRALPWAGIELPLRGGGNANPRFLCSSGLALAWSCPFGARKYCSISGRWRYVEQSISHFISSPINGATGFIMVLPLRGGGNTNSASDFYHTKKIGCRACALCLSPLWSPCPGSRGARCSPHCNRTGTLCGCFAKVAGASLLPSLGRGSFSVLLIISHAWSGLVCDLEQPRKLSWCVGFQSRVELSCPGSRGARCSPHCNSRHFVRVLRKGGLCFILLPFCLERKVFIL